MNRDKTTEHEARQNARQVLSQSAGFHALSKPEQREVYQSAIDEEYHTLARAKGLITEEDDFATAMGEKGASRQIDENRHVNTNLDKAGERMADLVGAVNFPDFVRDLLNGVFDANLEVSIKQMEQYQALLKEATKSTAEFVKQVSRADSYAYLAQNTPDFSFGTDASGEATLSDTDGNPVNVNDNTVKVKIMDAQLAIANERRKLLRETIMMGINRLVIERGEVNAKVVFDIKSKSTVDKADNSSNQFTQNSEWSRSGKSWWRNHNYESSTTSNHSNMSISSAKSQSEDELKANLTGEVKIVFKSDYFKLDNFADELQGNNQNRRPSGGAGANAQQESEA